MGQARVYIKPFDEQGNYEDDYTEVTKYVKTLGKISIDTDSSDFQVGIYRQSNVNIKLGNRDGLFSDIDFVDSLFKYKRSDSIIRITWDQAPEAALCGMVFCGEFIVSEELEMFKGLLSDESLTENAKQEDVDFYILGFEALFSRADIPFTSLANGDLVSEAMFTILNQTYITDLLTIDIDNLTPDLDLAIDDVTPFENNTVREALDTLLTISNSVLKIEDDVVYVTSRDASVSVEQTFYGQASQSGIENIITVDKISNGLSRTFNYWTWKDQSNRTNISPSIALYGIRKYEIDSDLFTDNSKRETILQDFAAEFGYPMQELEMETSITYETLERVLLDRVNIDYPTVLVPSLGFDFPICGIAICGEGVLPRGLWALTIPSDREFKILKKVIDLKKETVNFKLREVS